MTTEQNIRAILETSFAGFRDDIIRCYAQKCAPYTRCNGCKKYCEL